MTNSRLVYSTGDGDQRKRKREEEPVQNDPPRDGVVRIFRGKGGRGGKTMTVVRGLPPGDVAGVAKDLKRFLGSGGTAKDGAVELQGDHREQVAARLSEQGYTVRLAGG